MMVPTLDTLRSIQQSVKDAMDENTLTTVKDEQIVEEPIDADLHRQLRDAWKHVFEMIRQHYPDAVSHKIRSV